MEPILFQQTNFNEKPRTGRSKKILLFFVVLTFGFVFFYLGQKPNTITSQNKPLWQKVFGLFAASVNIDKSAKEELNKNFPIPAKEKERLDILILGIRGVDDPDGGLLTDSILLFSFNKSIGKSALISIPRDIYVDLPSLAKGKINEIYEHGYLKKEEFSFAKESFSRLTGVYIDNIVVFNFAGFKDIVKNLGGIDVNLKQPFEERQQWGYTFSLPAGQNHLDGDSALYYARSRFSSSDFDRSRRQQEIISAIKNKALSLGVLANPVKLISFLNSLKKNISTDFNLLDTASLLQLSASLVSPNGKLINYNISTENVLYETFQDKIYILLPKNDDWTVFRNFFKNLL